MRTLISNMLYIKDPTPELTQFAKDQLELPNPDYAKKERMGFWTGRTPKTLRLYEWHGNTLVLPFGLVRELMPLLQAGEIYNDFSYGADLTQHTNIDYGAPVPLRDYQREAVLQMVIKRYGILKSPAGSGKTQMGIALIKVIGKRALWLCHTADLLNQSRDRALMYMDENLIGTITEGKVNIGTGVTFATVQTMCNVDLERYKYLWDVIIVDECFPCNVEIMTPNGTAPIGSIRSGDEILSITKTGKVVKRTVRKVFKRIPESIIKVTLKNGKTIACTPNHPFLTQRGYVNAGLLTDMDSVYCMREASGHIINEPAEEILHSSQRREGILLMRVRKKREERLDRGTERKSETNDDIAQQANSVWPNEGKEPNEKPGYKGTCKKAFKRNKSATFRPWWKRTWANKNPGCYAGSAESMPSGSGICHSDENPKGKRISNELQGGPCIPGREDCNRNRRKFSLFAGTSAAGREETGTFEWVRVDRVEVQKQTSDGTYGGLCPDGFVYNLHVRKNHNYFANGINVHNCHRVSQSATTVSRYQKVLNNLSARHKYGLTATPERSDGLIKATFALIGQIAYEVPKAAVEDNIMRVTVRPVETDTEITDRCLNVDGTIDHTKLIEHLTTDEDRTNLIISCILENKGHSCLILSDRIAHLEDIRDGLPEDMKAESALITGKMTSKKGKAERQAALEKMRTGELKYLFASYSLAKEGLDVPRLDRLFLASPVKFSSVVIQSIGRIARTFPGKETPVCYDFVDSEIGFCQRAYRERCRHYRKENAVIEKGFLME